MNYFTPSNILLILSIIFNVFLASRCHWLAIKNNSSLDSLISLRKIYIDNSLTNTHPLQKQIYDLFKIALEKKIIREKVRYRNQEFTITVTSQKETENEKVN